MIRGTTRPLRPSAQKKLDFRASIHNRFDVEVIDAATGEIKQRARGYNIICSTLWQRLFAYNAQNHWTPQDYFNYVLYGGGSGTPAAADTELFELIGYKTASGLITTANIAAGVVYCQTVVTLQAEDAVGETLTEVGIGYDQTHIVTHAMLEDMNGNPISIDKTDTDVIKIFATVYVHFPAGGWHSSSVTVAEIDFNQISSTFFGILTGYQRAASKVEFRLLGAGMRTGKNTGYISSTIKTPIEVIGGNQIECKNRIPAADLNLPIRSILVGCGPEETFWMTPGLWASYSDVDSEPVGTGDGASVGFATAFPVSDGYAVYVNGTEAENVTFRPGPAEAVHMENWFNACYRNADGTADYYTDSYAITAPVYVDYFTGLRISTTVGLGSAALENPFSAIGIAKVRGIGRYSDSSGGPSVARIEVSNDMLTWESAGTLEMPYRSGVVNELTIPQALRTRKYWRVMNTGPIDGTFYLQFVGDVADTAHNIVFSSPPAAGAVITADYEPDCIPKDVNHVFDIDLVITVGEYQEV